VLTSVKRKLIAFQSAPWRNVRVSVPEVTGRTNGSLQTMLMENAVLATFSLIPTVSPLSREQDRLLLLLLLLLLLISITLSAHFTGPPERDRYWRVKQSASHSNAALHTTVLMSALNLMRGRWKKE
jgi:hypothetical protein